MAVTGEIVRNDVVPKYLEMRLLAGQTAESIAIYQAGGPLPSKELIERFVDLVWPENPTPATIVDAMNVFETESLEDLRQKIGSLKFDVDSTSDDGALNPETYRQIMSTAESYRHYAALKRAQNIGSFLTSVT